MTIDFYWDEVFSGRTPVEIPFNGDVRTAAWTADGSRIVYAELFEEVSVVNADGRGDRTLFRPGPLSPGSEFIVRDLIAFAPRSR